MRVCSPQNNANIVKNVLSLVFLDLWAKNEKAIQTTGLFKYIIER
jgi:hypothetical protein